MKNENFQCSEQDWSSKLNNFNTSLQKRLKLIRTIYDKWNKLQGNNCTRSRCKKVKTEITRQDMNQYINDEVGFLNDKIDLQEQIFYGKIIAVKVGRKSEGITRTDNKFLGDYKNFTSWTILKLFEI